MNAAVKESPAPTVSATSTFGSAGTTHYGGEYIAAVNATGEDEHLKVVFSKQYPALILKVYAG